MMSPCRKAGWFPAPVQETAREIERGVILFFLTVHRLGQMGRVNRQPGRTGRKAAIIIPPGQRRPAAVTTLVHGPEPETIGVLQPREGDIGLRQAQFLTLIQKRRPAEGTQ